MVELSKVLVLSFCNVDSDSNSSGGAARAATNIFACFIKNGLTASFWVARKYGLNESISARENLLGGRLCDSFAKIDFKVCKFLDSHCKEWQTSGLVGGQSAKKINKSSFEVVNLHWLGHGLISIRQLLKINKPIVWTLHDEWIIHDISHYPKDVSSSSNSKEHWIRKKLQGYILKLIRKRKRRFVLANNVFLICPSQDLYRKVLECYPEKKASIFLVENPVDHNIFHLQRFSRIVSKSSNSRPIVIFAGGVRDLRKGWDLVRSALDSCNKTFDLIVVGAQMYEFAGKTQQIKVVGIPKVTQELLSFLFNASCLTVITSRIESGGPQVAAESISCGTPVVGFNVGHLKEMLSRDELGRVITNFCVLDLAHAIDNQVVRYTNSNVRESLATESLTRWSYSSVFKKYKIVFDAALSRNV